MPESVVVISAVDPYPTDAGKKIVLAGFIEYFTNRLGPNNVHYLMVGGQSRSGFPARFHPLPKPGNLAKLGNVLFRTGTGQASLQESLLRSARVREAIHTKLDRISPTFELYDTVRMAQFAPARTTQRQICYLDDLFSERYRAMLTAAERYPDVDIQPLGNFESHVPEVLRPLAQNRRSQRLLLRLEEQLIRRSEDRSVYRYPSVLLLNEREAEVLRSRSACQTNRVATVPPLIRSPISHRNYSGGTDFVFLGQLSLPHNDDGLRSFLKDVWWRVLAARPEARLRVIGRNPRSVLTEDLARYGESVTLEGFVPDLAHLLSRSAALVNPLRFGSGVKLKIIEALGVGLPVISTTIGADGVAHGPDQGVLIADEAEQLAELLLSVTHPLLNAELSEAAREHFTRKYSREAVFTRYDTVFALG